MKLMPNAWIEKSIDRRVNTWCQKNRWTQLRINAEGLWVAIPPGETEHMEVPPVAYASRSGLKLRALYPYIPLMTVLSVMISGYAALLWQAKGLQDQQLRLSQQLQQMSQDLHKLQQKRAPH